MAEEGKQGPSLIVLKWEMSYSAGKGFWIKLSSAHKVGLKPGMWIIITLWNRALKVYASVIIENNVLLLQR